MALTPVGDKSSDRTFPIAAGVLSFDGEAWGHFLEGACVGDVSAAPDGSVWVVVDPPWPTDPNDDAAVTASGLYVITPEAVAATE